MCKKELPGVTVSVSPILAVFCYSVTDRDSLIAKKNILWQAACDFLFANMCVFTCMYVLICFVAWFLVHLIDLVFLLQACIGVSWGGDVSCDVLCCAVVCCAVCNHTIYTCFEMKFLMFRSIHGARFDHLLCKIWSWVASGGG